MNDRDQNIYSHLPLDAHAWRGVLTGLKMVRYALSGAIIGFLLFLTLLPITYVLFQYTDWGWLGLGLLGVYYLCLPLLLLLGMGLCCTAPSEAGAKHLAQAALVLTLTTVGMIGGGLVLEVLHENHWLPRGWLSGIDGQGFLSLLAPIMMMLSGLLAVVCWLWNLRALARYFGNHNLADQTVLYQWWFGTWGASSFAMYALIIASTHDILMAGIPCYGLYTILSVPVLYGWQLVMLAETEQTILKALWMPVAGSSGVFGKSLPTNPIAGDERHKWLR